MIFRNQGIVVGMLDDISLKLTDVEDDRLAALVDGWRESGIMVRGPATAEEGERQPDSGDAPVQVDFTAENLSFFIPQFEAAGYEVQRA